LICLIPSSFSGRLTIPGRKPFEVSVNAIPSPF
jgi:hypothetical protein